MVKGSWLEASGSAMFLLEKNEPAVRVETAEFVIS
jgi:hypothetical protein